MALTICPVCKNRMSDKAQVCPHCGYKNQPNESKSAFTKKPNKVWLVFSCVLLLLALYCASIFLFGFPDFYNEHEQWLAEDACYELLVTFAFTAILTYTRNSSTKILVTRIILMILVPLMIYLTIRDLNRTNYRYQYTNYATSQATAQNSTEGSISIVGEYDIEDCWSMGAITWRLVVNEDGSCTLRYVEGEKVAYGSWTYYQHKNGYHLTFDDFQPVVHFPNDNPMNPQGLHYPYIDEGIEWIYQDSHAFDAKNPNKRLPIKRIK